MIRKAYARLKRAFPYLPTFKAIDREFEIGTIEKTQALLREIKKKILEKIELAVELLESILLPEPSSFAQVYESGCFGREEKQQLLQLFRRAMSLKRTLTQLDYVCNEKALAKAIAGATKDWPGLRQRLSAVIGKLKGCWEKAVEEKELQRYFG